jgi:phosphohistidine phosphatase
MRGDASMTTTLLLLRHGKSDWGTDTASDHARPLAPRGRRAAKEVGRLLRRLELVPDGVLCSTAVRARTTVELAMEAGEWGSKVRWSDQLYDSSPEVVLAEIAGEPSTTRTLLVAGHEPVWSALVARVIGGGAIRFPTAALACVLPFSDRWAELPRIGGELAWLLPPRILAGDGGEKAAG